MHEAKITVSKLYHEMNGFSIGLFALGIELAILLNIAAIILFATAGSFANTYAVINLGEAVVEFAQKISLLTVLVSLATDIALQIEKKKSAQ